MRHAGRGVARCIHGKCRQRADPVGIAVIEQLVELTAVTLKFRALVKHLAEGFLYDGDVSANPDPATQLALQIWRARQVVGVNMGFD